VRAIAKLHRQGVLARGKFDLGFLLAFAVVNVGLVCWNADAGGYWGAVYYEVMVAGFVCHLAQWCYLHTFKTEAEFDW
jgi:hypothetical protein